MADLVFFLTNGDDKFYGSLYGANEIVFGFNGDDEIQTAGGWDTLYGGDGEDYLAGGDQADLLYGETGNDRLQGGAGADLIDGGPGVDWAVYTQSILGVTIDLQDGFTSSGHAIGDTLYNIENLYGTNRKDSFYGNSGKNWFMGEGGNDYLNGRGGNDILWSGPGNDTMVGGTGNDVMMGGEGDDIYLVDSTGDTVWEDLGEGDDTVKSVINFSIANFPTLENVTLLEHAKINATGNALDNVLRGNTGVNKLTGGKGYDHYFVQNTGDTTVELAGGGIDLVTSTVSYKLAANVENLTLTGTSPLFGHGNELDNTLVGNTGNNILVGKGGSDRYVVQDAADQVIDSSGVHDIIESSVTYTLPTSIEELELSGSANVNGFGHNGINILRGNSGKNMLVGKGGDDSYFVGPGDQVVEAANGGSDTVHSNGSFILTGSIESLLIEGYSDYDGRGNDLDNSIHGNAFINRLEGKGGDDWIWADKGNDQLVGGAGADKLRGREGNDMFIYEAASDSTPLAPDTIFDHGDLNQDHINLSALSPQLLSFIGTAAFSAARQVRVNDIVGPDVRVEVNLTGTSVAEMVIILANTTAVEITATDFVL